MGGRDSSSGRGGGGSGIDRAARNPERAAEIAQEINKLDAERERLVERFARAEDSNNTAAMESLRNMIDAIDRDRKNANKRYRYYRYGETF